MTKKPRLPVTIKALPNGRHAYHVDMGDRPEDDELVDTIRNGLIRLMETPPDGTPPQEVLMGAIDDVVARLRLDMPSSRLTRVKRRIRRELLGYGLIDVLMHDPDVEDITCDGPGIPIFVFHRQLGPMETNLAFPDDEGLDRFVVRLAEMSNREITYARPLLESALPDGSRLQATLAREVTTRGSSFTIRRFKPDPMTPVDLIQNGTMSAEMAAYLWMAVEGGVSMIFAGGTASGKTTALNASCAFIPPDQKVVSIEDTRELNLPQKNWTAGVTRPAPAGSSGEAAQNIDMFKLLESALRQRPDYILVGEVRGPEAVTLFQAMATGHATFSTIHADSPLTAVRRLENPPINVPRNLIEALGLMIMNRRVTTGDAGARRMTEISEITGVEEQSGDLLTRVVYRWNPADDVHEYMGRSAALEALIGQKYADGEALQAEWDRRTHLLKKLAGTARVDMQVLVGKLLLQEAPA